MPTRSTRLPCARQGSRGHEGGKGVFCLVAPQSKHHAGLDLSGFARMVIGACRRVLGPGRARFRTEPGRNSANPELSFSNCFLKSIMSFGPLRIRYRSILPRQGARQGATRVSRLPASCTEIWTPGGVPNQSDNNWSESGIQIVDRSHEPGPGGTGREREGPIPARSGPKFGQSGAPDLKLLPRICNVLWAAQNTTNPCSTFR